MGKWVAAGSGTGDCGSNGRQEGEDGGIGRVQQEDEGRKMGPSRAAGLGDSRGPEHQKDEQSW